MSSDYNSLQLKYKELVHKYKSLEELYDLNQVEQLKVVNEYKKVSQQFKLTHTQSDYNADQVTKLTNDLKMIIEENQKQLTLQKEHCNLIEILTTQINECKLSLVNSENINSQQESHLGDVMLMYKRLVEENEKLKSMHQNV